MSAPLPARYHPYYCEENVYHLAGDPALRGRPREVVFISNPTRSCAVWHQRAAARAHSPIVWDYHVILLCRDPWEVIDHDSTLGAPCEASAYFAKSFRSGLGREFEAMFRVVDADLYLSAFASDRSHMRSASGSYLRPPPPWPPLGAGAPSNLERFVDMTSPFLGEVMDKATLAARFSA